MDFGFSTYFVTDRSLDGVVDAILDTGFKTVELSYEPPHLFAMNDEMIGKLRRLRDDGISFSMHGPFLETNLASYLDDVRDLAAERVLAAVRLSAKVGADPMVVHPGYSFFRKLRIYDGQLRQRFLDTLGTIQDEARDLGVRIALENVFMSYFYLRELDEFEAIREAVPGIGVTLDIGHAYISKRMAGVTEPEDAILDDVRRMGIEHLFHVHLHNNDGSRDDHDFLSGSIDMAKVLAGLKDLGYAGKVIIETLDAEKHGFEAIFAKLNEITP